jgi:hypothetical protein
MLAEGTTLPIRSGQNTKGPPTDRREPLVALRWFVFQQMLIARPIKSVNSPRDISQYVSSAIQSQGRLTHAASTSAPKSLVELRRESLERRIWLSITDNTHIQADTDHFLQRSVDTQNRPSIDT